MRPLRNISHGVYPERAEGLEMTRRMFLTAIPGGCEESFPRDFSLSAGLHEIMNHFVVKIPYPCLL